MKFIAYHQDPKKRKRQRWQLLILAVLAPFAFYYGQRAFTEWSTYERARTLVRKGDLKMQDGQALEAVKLFKQAVHTYPVYHDAWTSLFMAYHALGDHQSEAEACHQALALAPESGEFHRDFGIALHEIGSHNQELQHLLQAQTLGAIDDVFTKSLLDRAHREQNEIQASHNQNTKLTMTTPEKEHTSGRVRPRLKL